MARPPQFRMTVSTGNEAKFSLFQNIIQDAAVLDDVTPSAVVIERCISPTLPPRHYWEAYEWARKVYCGAWGIKDALAQIFSENYLFALLFPESYVDYNQLVLFGYRLALDWELHIDTTSSKAQESIEPSLEWIINKADSDCEARLLSSDINNDRFISDVLLFVLNNWEPLRADANTFDVLGRIFQLSTGWRDCKVTESGIELLRTHEAAARRKELVDVLVSIKKA